MPAGLACLLAKAQKAVYAGACGECDTRAGSCKLGLGRDNSSRHFWVLLTHHKMVREVQSALSLLQDWTVIVPGVYQATALAILIRAGQQLRLELDCRLRCVNIPMRFRSEHSPCCRIWRRSHLQRQLREYGKQKRWPKWQPMSASKWKGATCPCTSSALSSWRRLPPIRSSLLWLRLALAKPLRYIAPKAGWDTILQVV